MSDYTPPMPDEMLQIVKCPGCELTMFIDNIEPVTGDEYATDHKMQCGNCQTIVSAEHIYDYVMLGGVHTDG